MYHHKVTIAFIRYINFPKNCIHESLRHKKVSCGIQIQHTALFTTVELNISFTRPRARRQSSHQSQNNDRTRPISARTRVIKKSQSLINIIKPIAPITPGHQTSPGRKINMHNTPNNTQRLWPSSSRKIQLKREKFLIYKMNRPRAQSQARLSTSVCSRYYGHERLLSQRAACILKIFKSALSLYIAPL